MLELPTRVIVIMILEILGYVAGDDKITQSGGGSFFYVVIESIIFLYT